MSQPSTLHDARVMLTDGLTRARELADATDWAEVRVRARQGVRIDRGGVSARGHALAAGGMGGVAAVSAGATHYLMEGSLWPALGTAGVCAFVGAICGILGVLMISSWFDGLARIPHRLVRNTPEFDLTLERTANPNGTLTLTLWVQRMRVLSFYHKGVTLYAETVAEATVLPDADGATDFLAEMRVMVEDTRTDILAGLEADRALIAERLAHAKGLAESTA